MNISSQADTEVGNTNLRMKCIEECGYPFKFSVITAVYNVELYLNEAVNSILKQNIGFLENVQLILVDDGSKDRSGAICDEYALMFPNNIVVIHKENGGVSSARNEGLKYAEGKYLNFMDSDDKFTENVLKCVYDFFIQHDEETDIVMIPHQYFDGRTGEPWQNDKFRKGTRLINLRIEYKTACMTTNSSFIHTRRKEDIQFDSHLNCAEDLKVIVTLLLDKMVLGVVKDCTYKYRRVTGGSSLIDTSQLRKSWYTDHLVHLTYWMYDYCMREIGFYPFFAQYNILSDLSWRFKQIKISENILSQEEAKDYKTKLFGSVSFFCDDIINNDNKLWVQYKIFLLQQKYKKTPNWYPIKSDALLYFGNTILGWASRFYTRFEFIRIEDNKLILEGYTKIAGCTKDEVANVCFLINKSEKIDSILTERFEVSDYCHEELLFRGIGFYGEIPLDSKQELYSVQLICMIHGVPIVKKDLRFGKFSPIGKQYQNIYVNEGWSVFLQGDALKVRRCGRKGMIVQEYYFLKKLWKSKKKSDRKAAKARIIYHILKFFLKKPIWLISDRNNKADDNGEALFHYINKIQPKKINTYFVLDKSSPDFNRLSRVGKVVDSFSVKHKLLFLLCQFNISSQADYTTDNPFQSFFEPYRDIIAKHQYVFLQHGITQNDISSWLNRFNKNISIFVTAAKEEMQSILEYNYYYNKNNVLLSGFPRYDLLYHDEQKIITFMPTWRKYLMKGMDSESGIWTIDNEFTNSTYFYFYTHLLCHPRLLKAAKEKQYQIWFMPHPTIQPHISVFSLPNEIKVIGIETSYRDVYAQSDLVVTDYSSAVFDFAYLRKPIVYCQFDQEDFFQGDHVCTRGYFDYKRDGFGEVECDLESTVERIIEYMESGCQLKEKYRKRIDDFFAYDDQNNCQRVYDAICQLGEEGF